MAGLNGSLWLCLLLAFPLLPAAANLCDCSNISDWNDPVFSQCNFWGDVHVTSSWRTPEIFDFQGLGVYRYAAAEACNTDFELQAFQCPLGDTNKGVITGAALQFSNGSSLEVVLGNVLDPPGIHLLWLGEEGNLSAGAAVVSEDQCIRFSIDARSIIQSPGMYHNIRLRTSADRTQARGICGSRSQSLISEYVEPGDAKFLFTSISHAHLCRQCEESTGFVVPGCPRNGVVGTFSPGCEVVSRSRPNEAFRVLDCQDPTIKSVYMDACQSFIDGMVPPGLTCDDFCRGRNTICYGTARTLNNETKEPVFRPGHAPCNAADDENVLVGCRSADLSLPNNSFRTCLCRAFDPPPNPFPGPTVSEACAAPRPVT